MLEFVLVCVNLIKNSVAIKIILQNSYILRIYKIFNKKNK